MKKTICRALGLLLCLLLLTAVLTELKFLTDIKEGHNEKAAFFDCAEECDLLIFGNSRMRDAVIPMELWGEYGIAAYNLSSPGVSVADSYWLFMNALDYARPELVLLDCSGLDVDAQSSLPYFQSALAPFPLTGTKLKTAFGAYPPAEHGLDDTFSIIWSFSRFHGRWDELEAGDFALDNISVKGGITVLNVAEPDEMKHTDERADWELISRGASMLRLFAEECERRGIELVLCQLPFPGDLDSVRVANSTGDLAAELGLEYINFLDMDVVNYSADMNDPDSHLNYSGALKVTDYFGQMLSENYGLSDRRGQAAYIHWDELYGEYLCEKDERLAVQTLMERELLLLSDSRYSSVIQIAEGSLFYDDAKHIALLENIAGRELPLLQQAKEEHSAWMMFVDRENGEVFESLNAAVDNTAYGALKADHKNARLSIGASDYGLSCESADSGTSDVQCYVFGPGFEPLPQCSHSFAWTQNGAWERTDY